ncbi:MAG: cation:proton antiporter [Roseomonas sp.]|nr:cation:proton antiporter [Roseomonas sp.]MCA3328976.1 cation:proton antiporter [Roseomonas sp.]MCA3332030.1 cation:proton antiporter [Roseomonas sp.]MCA3334678.1 cation:proton antiporter [Roseomonas sp.]MCA3346929.1 cation:proton antiporter [Roseomonas sp.]
MAEGLNIQAYSDALVVLGTAGVIVPLLRRVGISPVLGYLGAGAVLGPLALGSFIKEYPLLYWFTVIDAKSVTAIAELGVVFLLFLIGLELSFDRLKAMRRLVLGLGGLQLAITFVVLSLLALLLGFSPGIAAVLAACLALSSTAIVLELLAQQERLLTSGGRASFSVLLAQDVAVVPILLFIGILGAKGGSSVLLSIAIALGQALLVLALIVLVGRVVLRPLFRLVGGQRSEELFIAAVLFVIVATGIMAAMAGLSMAIGAFVAGLLLAETEYRRAVQATIEPFKGLLLGIFFFSVGMSIDFREVAREPVLLFGLAFGLVVLKAGIVYGLARHFALTRAAALESALLLGPGGEFAFVGIGLATGLALIEPRLAGFILAAISLTMAMLPLLSALARRLAPLLEEARPRDLELEALPGAQQGHAIIIGYGRVGKTVAALLRQHGLSQIAVDNDPATVSRARRAGEGVFFGDAARTAFLQACGLASAQSVIITISVTPQMDKIIAAIRSLRPDLPIISRARDAAHARHLYAQGVSDTVPETIEASLQLSEAALVSLGVPIGRVIASIHQKRADFAEELRSAARGA